MKEDMSTLHKDFVASNLRSQLDTLYHLLEDVQGTKCFESDYAVESLRRVEGNLKKLRTFLNSHMQDMFWCLRKNKKEVVFEKKDKKCVLKAPGQNILADYVEERFKGWEI